VLFGFMYDMLVEMRLNIKERIQTITEILELDEEGILRGAMLNFVSVMQQDSCYIWKNLKFLLYDYLSRGMAKKLIPIIATLMEKGVFGEFFHLIDIFLNGCESQRREYGRSEALL
jgi:hypothetical protein